MTSVLPILTKHNLQGTSVDDFLSASISRAAGIIPNPISSAKLITIPTTPVKRRRHRNDTIKSHKKMSKRGKSYMSSQADHETNSLKKDTKSNIPKMKLPTVNLASSTTKKFEMSKEKLFKYRQWFMSIDADGSGTVDRSELFDSFVSSGVVASSKTCGKLFEVMDVDGTGEVDFDNFIRTITSSSMSKAVQMHKLDSMINSQSALSTETLLSQERRKILMKFVVDKDKLHDFEIESLTTDDKKAQMKLAKLHKPMKESRLMSGSGYTKKEIDEISASMQKGNQSKSPDGNASPEDSASSPNALPRANMERRRTRTNGFELGFAGGLGATKSEGSFKIQDLIKRNEERAAEKRRYSEVSEALSNVVVAEKKEFEKRTRMADISSNIVLIKRFMKNSLGSRKSVADYNLDDLRKELNDSACPILNNLNTIEAVEEGKEDDCEDESINGGQLDYNVDERIYHSQNLSDDTVPDATGTLCRISNPIISTKVKGPKRVKKSNIDLRNGSSVVLRPIGFHCR